MLRQHPRLTVVLALGAIYVIWGSTYLAIRLGVQEIPPFLMAGGRFLAAGIPLFLWARRRSSQPLSRRHWRNAALIGGLMLVGGNGLVTIAEQTVISSVAAIVITTVPLWLVGLDAVFYRRRGLDPLVALGLVLGFAGVVVLMRPTADALTTVPIAGGILLLVASFSWANGSLLSRRVELPRSIFLAIAMEMIAAGTIMLAVGLARGEAQGFDPRAVSVTAWGSLAYLAVFGSIVALSAYTWLLQNCSAAMVGTYAFVNPIVAVVLGWWLADEQITATTGLAGGLIVGAVLIIQLRSRGERRQVEEPPVARPMRTAGAVE